MAVVKSSFLGAVVVYLLMGISDSQSSNETLPPRNLLSDGIIHVTASGPNDALCCIGANCFNVQPPTCAIDNNLTTVWTLKNGTMKAHILIQLNASSLVSKAL